MRTRSSAIAEARQRRSALFWPLLIVGLLVLHVVGMMTATVIATRDRSFVVLPNYYQRALHWEERKAAADASERLGWTRRIELGAYDAARRTRAVQIRLADRDGRPVDGLTLRVNAAPELRPTETQSLTFAPHGPGVYAADVLISTDGPWTFDIDATGADGVRYVALAEPWLGR